MKKAILKNASLQIEAHSVGIDLNSAAIGCEYVAKSADGYSYLVNENGTPQAKYFFELIKSGDKIFQKSPTSKLVKNVYNTALDSLLLRMRKTNMNPEYQRGLVWNINDKRKLIDALVQGRSIGAITFAKNDFKDEFLYEILDGKQRLSAIAEFIADGFDYQGIRFSELCSASQLEFFNLSLGVIDVSFDNDREKIEYFIELNSAGVKVSNEFLDDLRKLVK
jgi:hypothetical protein